MNDVSGWTPLNDNQFALCSHCTGANFPTLPPSSPFDGQSTALREVLLARLFSAA